MTRKKISLTKNPAPTNRIDIVFSSETCFGTKFREVGNQQQPQVAANFVPRNGIRSNLRLLLILFRGTEFRVGFSSAEWFGTEFQVLAFFFVPRYRILNIFLLCGVVQKGIPRVSCSAEQSEFRRNKPIVPSIPSSEEYFFLQLTRQVKETYKLTKNKEKKTGNFFHATEQRQKIARECPLTSPMSTCKK